MKSLPLRLELALLSAAISGAVLLSFGAAAWYLIYQQRIEAVDREIRTLASRHPGWFINRGNYPRLSSALEFTFGEHRKTNVIILILDQAEAVLYRSEHWPEDLDETKLPLPLEDKPSASPSTAAAREMESPSADGPPWGPGGRVGMGRGQGWGRGGHVTFTKRSSFSTVRTASSAWRLGMFGTADTILVLGMNHDEVQGELADLRKSFLLTLPAVLLLVGLGGWFVAGRALRPLTTIAETAEHVTARGLAERIPLLDDDPEIKRVIQVLNRMMDRLEVSFRQATRFSADASHELKTPLAIMQGELENALHASQPGSSEQQVFSNLLEETQRLKTITRSLLLLAQLDAGQVQLSKKPVNLSALLEHLIEDVRLLAEESRLTIDPQLQTGVVVEADEALICTALLNLLVNAVKFNEPGGRITVVLTSDAAQAVLNVGNSGPGIPPEEQPKLFQRFYRADPIRSRTVDGLGLGLSLAREIVRGHDGDLQLQESRPGWTCFVLRMNCAGAAVETRLNGAQPSSRSD